MNDFFSLFHFLGEDFYKDEKLRFCGGKKTINKNKNLLKMKSNVFAIYEHEKKYISYNQQSFLLYYSLIISILKFIYHFWYFIVCLFAFWHLLTILSSKI